MPTPEKKSDVVLEDLLRWKRHEQPAEEFWDDFDHRLKERTLHSIMQKKSVFDWSAEFLFSKSKFLISSAAAIAALGFGLAHVFEIKQSRAVVSDSFYSHSHLAEDLMFTASQYGQAEIEVLRAQKANVVEEYAYENVGYSPDLDSSFGLEEVSLVSFDGRSGRVFF